MNRPTDEHLLAFLEGSLDEAERAAVLEAVTLDPRLAAELRFAAFGLAMVEPLGKATDPGAAAAQTSGRRISPWWAVAAAAATLLVAVPATLWTTRQSPVAEPATAVLARAREPEPGFVMVLHGKWPDAGSVSAAETRRRAVEYWAWTASLADDSVLMAAGDLRWEPGSRLGPNGTPVAVSEAEVESADFVVGMFALRVTSYEDAVAIARQCPHLRYGGSVSIRRVARGFLTTPRASG